MPLAQHFLKKYSENGKPSVEITPRLRQMLMAHSWPGNIRELENAIRKLVVLREPDMVADDLRQAALRRQLYPSRNAPPAASPSQTSSEVSVLPPIEEEVRPVASAAVIPSEVPSSGVLPSAANGNGNGSEPKETSILGRVDEARRQAEIEAIVAALNASLWNRKQAAALLSIEYKALLYKMKKLGIGEKHLSAANF